MKFFLLLLLFTIELLCANAQGDKTVTLTVTGQGKTIDEARQNALRSAIEQAFGTFISSNTKILDDKLVNDEIISITNGNIQKYDILNEMTMPDGSFAATLNAVISINKLSSFCENKGIAIEFKGALFALNMKMQLLNEQNEILAIKNTCDIIKQIADKSFDYSLKVSDPLKDGDDWRIPIEINVSANENFFKIPELLDATLSGLSLKGSDVDDYLSKNKMIYPITFGASNSKYGYFFLRSPESVVEIIKMLYYFNHSVQNFKISNGIETMTLSSLNNKYYNRTNIYPINSLLILDKKFGLFLTKIDFGGSHEVGSVFYEPIFDSDNFPPTLSYEKIDSRIQLNHFVNDLYLGDKVANFDNYSFIKDVQKKVKKNKGKYVPGMVISFIGISTMDKSLIQFITNDFRTIEEISKITEYKIVPAD